MATLNSLMKHLRENGVSIGGSSQKRKLKNIGYYHGYKGYRFAKSSNRPLPISSFDDIVALNAFDADLKALFYPKLMLLETALKNYTIEAILNVSKSERIDDVWNQCVTGYRECKGKAYKEAWEKRLRLRREIDDLVFGNRNKDVIRHFWSSDRDIPIWALCEVMTMGHFGNLYVSLSSQVKLAITSDLSMPTNVDSPSILASMIFALKDLRNAVAHNGVVFDVRFRTGKISKRVSGLLNTQMHTSSIDFVSITDYVLMILYLMKAIGCPATECRKFIASYSELVNKLRSTVSSSVFSLIITTDSGQKIKAGRQYVNAKQPQALPTQA